MSNDTISTAEDLGSYSYYNDVWGYVGGFDPTDFFKFDVSGTGSADIYLSNMSADLDLYVYDSSGVLIASSLNSGTTPDYVSINFWGGFQWLYVEVDPYLSAESSYLLDVDIYSSYSYGYGWQYGWHYDYYFTGWAFGWSVGWDVGWSVGWNVGWSVSWYFGWVADPFAGWVIGWGYGWNYGWNFGWSFDWYYGWNFGWYADYDYELDYGYYLGWGWIY